jgi:hypothetical protein
MNQSANKQTHKWVERRASERETHKQEGRVRSWEGERVYNEDSKQPQV